MPLRPDKTEDEWIVSISLLWVGESRDMIPKTEKSDIKGHKDFLCSEERILQAVKQPKKSRLLDPSIRLAHPTQKQNGFPG